MLGRENIFNHAATTGIRTYNFHYPEKVPVRSYALESLLSNGCEDMYNYVHWTGLVREAGMMVLLSISQYHYDLADLQNIRILINQKQLNSVRHLESYLHILFSALPADAYFLGCIKCNNHIINEKTRTSLRKFYRSSNGSDFYPERLFTKEGVYKLLEGQGYKVIDLTDMKGITYFCTRVKKTGE